MDLFLAELTAEGGSGADPLTGCEGISVKRLGMEG